MKRKFKKALIVIVNIILVTLMLFFYCVHSDVVFGSIWLFIMVGFDIIIVCVFYLEIVENEIEYVHKHLSWDYTTTVIPIIDDNASDLDKHIAQTATYKAMLSTDNIGMVNIYVQLKYEDLDSLHSTIDITNFRKHYKIN